MLNPQHAALVLIDVQGNLAQAMADKQRLIANLQSCIKVAQVLNIPIVWIEQYPEGLGETISELKELLPGQAPLSKTTFGCLSNARISEAISRLGRQQLLVCGIEAHVCVLQTTFDLLAAGFQVFVPADAVGSRSRLDWQIGLDRMAGAGAVITTTESVMFEWCERSDTPEFKQISKLVKDRQVLEFS